MAAPRQRKTASKAEKKVKPEPDHRTARLLKRRYRLIRFLEKKGPKIAGAASVTSIAAGGVAIYKGHPDIGTTGVYLGAIIALALRPMQRTLRRSGQKLDAKIIGRPALARHILAVEKDPELKTYKRLLAELPFVNSREIRWLLNMPETQHCWAKHIGADVKLDLKGLKRLVRFRCFSREEIEKLRLDFKQGKRSAIEMSYEMMREKMKIIGLAYLEPELTSIVFKELIPMKKISKTARAKATKLVSKLRTLKIGEEFRSTLDLKDEKMDILFKRTQTGWHFRKIKTKSKQ